jgi:hypothetical protein
VDVFFVICGYLITGLLVREFEARQTISFTGFYARRVRRILPAALFVIGSRRHRRRRLLRLPGAARAPARVIAGASEPEPGCSAPPTA